MRRELIQKLKVQSVQRLEVGICTKFLFDCSRCQEKHEGSGRILEDFIGEMYDFYGVLSLQIVDDERLWFVTFWESKEVSRWHVGVVEYYVLLVWLCLFTDMVCVMEFHGIDGVDHPTLV